MVTVATKDIAALVDTASDAQMRVLELEKALRSIATLWPLETCADISEVSGINDGRSRAIIAQAAVDAARKALGLKLTDGTETSIFKKQLAASVAPVPVTLIIVSGGVAEPANDDANVHILDLDNLRDADGGEFLTSTAAIEWLKENQPHLYEQKKHLIVNTDEE